jgi:hypothetical protein
MARHLPRPPRLHGDDGEAGTGAGVTGDRAVTTRRARACVGAIMKLEAPYIVEWVTWYRLLGFEVVIADHGGDDGQSELLAKLDALGLITRIDVGSWHGLVQEMVYLLLFRWARRSGFDYIGFLDADEFLEPMTIGDTFEGSGARLIDELFRTSNAAVLAFNWMIFGDSNLARAGPEPVTERFTWAAEQSFKDNRHVKSFCAIERCHALFRSHLRHERAIAVHVANVPCAAISHDGMPIRTAWNLSTTVDVSWQFARIRHYVIKSREEFRDKKARRSAWSNYNEEYFTYFARNEIHAPLPPHVIARLRQEIAKICGLLRKHPAVPVQPSRWFMSDQLRNRLQALPYLKGYGHSVFRRWRRGFDKAWARIRRARRGQGGG